MARALDVARHPPPFPGGAVVGDHPRRHPPLRGRGQAGRGLHSGQRAAGRGRGRRHLRRLPSRPGGHRYPTGDAAPDGRVHTTLDELGELADGQADDRTGGDGWPRAIPTSPSSPAGARAVPKGRSSPTGPTCCGPCPGALLEPRGAMVCPYPLFHMGAWTIALQQWQARDTVVFFSSGRRRGDLDGGGAPSGDPSERGARRVAADHRPGRGPGAPGPPSIRFADTGTSTTPPELLGRSPLPARRPAPGVLRVHGGRQRHASSTPTFGGSRAAAGSRLRRAGPHRRRRSTIGEGPIALRRLPRRPRTATARCAGRRLVPHGRSGRRGRRGLRHDRGSPRRRHPHRR